MPRSELIVALDVVGAAEALSMVDRLPPEVSWYKIGLELFCAEGPAVIQAVRARGKNVFLDLKLHDIPRTVERAILSAARHGAGMLTVHAAGGRAMLKAAADAARRCPQPPRLIAVTTLTSLDQRDLADLGIMRPPQVHVMSMADMALKQGIHGMVCSPQEVESLRARFGSRTLLVTPGIRPAGSDPGDQKRVATPSAAVRAGADFLVVGRPILEAPDPVTAARAILKEMAV
ncbi:MAG: orotidine-5'-phosphate decarboxylase [Verrucomicrobia bacterium]|nr:orotidine-5'-phosphate decarboxylase [Verrucomicrobiota bacterium]MBU1908455.1 orotidine-5'-phosphate decarboxylase [Verrucomicrobiota bacterium]